MSESVADLAASLGARILADEVDGEDHKEDVSHTKKHNAHTHVAKMFSRAILLDLYY